MMAQVEGVKEYASRNNLAVAGISTEYGGGLTLDRPGLIAVAKAVKAGIVDAVLVKNLSRIARGFLSIQQAVSFLNSHQVELILSDQDIGAFETD